MCHHAAPCRQGQCAQRPGGKAIMGCGGAGGGGGWVGRFQAIREGEAGHTAHGRRAATQLPLATPTHLRRTRRSPPLRFVKWLLTGCCSRHTPGGTRPEGPGPSSGPPREEEPPPPPFPLPAPAPLPTLEGVGRPAPTLPRRSCGAAASLGEEAGRACRSVESGVDGGEVAGKGGRARVLAPHLKPPPHCKLHLPPLPWRSGSVRDAGAHRHPCGPYLPQPRALLVCLVIAPFPLPLSPPQVNPRAEGWCACLCMHLRASMRSWGGGSTCAWAY